MAPGVFFVIMRGYVLPEKALSEAGNFNNQVRVVNEYEAVSPLRGAAALIVAILVFVLTVFWADAISPPFGNGIDVWLEENNRPPVNPVRRGEIKVSCPGKEQSVAISFLQSGCSVAAGAKGFFVWNPKSGGELRLGENSTLSFERIEGDALVLKPEKSSGELWISNSFAEQKTEIVFPRALVQINHGNAAFLWDEKGVKIFSFGGLTRVDLYGEDYDLSDRKKSLANSFFLPPYHQGEVLYDRINENTAKLYYSKLIKDFGVGAITADEIKNSPWLALNQELDRELISTRRRRLKEQLETLNKSGGFLIGNDLLYDAANIFTFNSRRADQARLARFDYLVSGVARHISRKDDLALSLSKSRLQSFLAKTVADDIDGRKRDFLSARVLQWQESMNVAVGDDDLLKLKQVLLTAFKDFLPSGSVYDQALDQILLVFGAVEFDSERARAAIKELNQFLEEDLPRLSDPVLRENINIVRSLRNLLESLLSGKDYFYDHDYFSGLFFLNNMIVELTDNQELREEEIQTAVQSYLRSVSRLVFWRKERGVANLDFAYSLLKEIGKLRPDKINDAAVTAFFLEEKNRLERELDFLLSAEFKELEQKSYNETRYNTALAEFIRLRQDRERLNQILKGENRNALSEAEIEIGPEQSRVNATAILRANGIAFRDLEPDSLHPRNVLIKGGSYGGLNFAAVLDVRTEFLYDLTLLEQKISSGFSIKDLPVILRRAALLSEEKKAPESKSETPLKRGETSSAMVEESLLEVVLREIARERMGEFGYSHFTDLVLLDKEAETVAIQDLNPAWGFRVDLHYDLKKNQFSQVVLGAEKIGGVYDISGLEQLIAAKRAEMAENIVSGEEG